MLVVTPVPTCFKIYKFAWRLAENKLDTFDIISSSETLNEVYFVFLETYLGE